MGSVPVPVPQSGSGPWWPEGGGGGDLLRSCQSYKEEGSPERPPPQSPGSESQVGLQSQHSVSRNRILSPSVLCRWGAGEGRCRYF